MSWFKNNKLETLPFVRVEPDKKGNWINLADSDFESLVPVASKEVKAGKSEEAIFELYSTGISTNRDEWVIDFSKEKLTKVMHYFVDQYISFLNHGDLTYPNSIKWSRNLKTKFKNKLKEDFNEDQIIKYNNRPYITSYIYNSRIFLDERGLTDKFFRSRNLTICISGNGSSKPFQTLAVDTYLSLDFLEKTQCLALYTYDKSGNRQDNITDWALNLFNEHYHHKPVSEAQLSAMGDAELAAFTAAKPITKEDIFHYSYAVLHNPAYRKKYELDLKRDFPRLPLYANFYQWAAWGKQLMDLHIGYETVEPYALKLIETKEEINEIKQKAMFAVAQEPEALYSKQPKLKVKLKADKESGLIELDEKTALGGIPASAWAYKLGNRSALEWVLDQYKEKKPTDPTIAEKFNTYRFADYKPHVIDLLKRVCTVSVETMRIIDEMNALSGE